MGYSALYQKYRSSTFDEVVGQEYVVKSIQNAMKQKKYGHAYLFCGPRGTGKTTMARLLAKAVNCENQKSVPCEYCNSCNYAISGTHPDIIEINAANETHVEDIRDLIERAKLAPMIGKFKVYIIDEVHQLSSSAASALLKTLEEPPSHVIFILATTDPQKLLNTIISRCQRFDFTKIESEKILNHLIEIAKKENIDLEVSAAKKIADLADGGMRDALSILEQTSSYANGKITEEDINHVYGLSSTKQKIVLLEYIIHNRLKDVLYKIKEYEISGIDVHRLTSELIDIIKEIIIYKSTKDADLLKQINTEQADMLSEKLSRNRCLKMIDIFMKAIINYKTARSVVSYFEIACMEVMEEQPIIEKQLSEVKENEDNQEIEIPIIESEMTEEKEIKSNEVENEQLIEVNEYENQEIHSINMNVETMLSILVQCTKELKSEDIEKIQPKLNQIIPDKYLTNLKQSNIVASGVDCIVFEVAFDAIANVMNEESYNRGLYEYLKEKFEIDKMPFIVSTKIYKEAIQEFIQCRKNGSLPQPMIIQRYQNEGEKEEILNSEQKMLKAFGSEMLEIIDGGN